MIKSMKTRVFEAWSGEDDETLKVEPLQNYSQYAWFGARPGCLARWKAFRFNRNTLDEHEEQLNLALDVFEKACMMENFTLFDLISFGELDRNTSALDFDYCSKLVTIVEVGCLSDATLADDDTVEAFVDFMDNVLGAVQAHVVDGKFFDIGDGVKRIIPPMFRSRSALIDAYLGEDGLGFLTKYLPGDFMSICSTGLKDPFRPMTDVPLTEKMLRQLAIVHWGLAGYSYVLRMVLTKDQIRYGAAADDTDGEKVDAFFMARGVKLNHSSKKFTYAKPSYGTRCFTSAKQDIEQHCIKTFEVTGTSEVKLVLPSPATMRSSAKTDEPLSKNIANEFRSTWRNWTAYYGQQIMRARYFDLVGTSRRELVHIRRIKELQDQAQAKVLAIGVTLGITCGQFVVQYVTKMYFPEEDACDRC